MKFLKGWNRQANRFSTRYKPRRKKVYSWQTYNFTKAWYFPFWFCEKYHTANWTFSTWILFFSLLCDFHDVCCTSWNFRLHARAHLSNDDYTTRIDTGRYTSSTCNTIFYINLKYILLSRRNYCTFEIFQWIFN